MQTIEKNKSWIVVGGILVLVIGIFIGTHVDSSGKQTETAQVQSASGDTTCVIKGNINSSGEKIYHLPGCASYNQTIIDESKGEKWFCSEADAQAAGWRKAENCY